MSGEQTAVLEGEVLEGRVLEGEVIEPAAEVMACEHAVSKMRVALVERLRERHPRPEHALDGVCACCGMPCRPRAHYCLVCSREPYGLVSQRWPYGEQAQ